MSSRIRHPAKSLILFLVVVGVGYAAWEHRHLVAMEPTEHLSTEQRMEIREDVVVAFQKNVDFLGFRAMSWRPGEQRYVIRIEVADGCTDPKGLCYKVAEFIEDQADVESTVIAVDSTDREIGRCVL